MEPRVLIQQWIELFNEGNASGLSELYSDNAVNHQLPNEPVKGKESIRQMFADEFSQADMTCIIENIFVDDDWAILEWKDPNGLRGCGFFQIANNKIQFQRGYWDKLSFLRMHNLPIPNK